MTQHDMKTNNGDVLMRSQRELAGGVLKQATQDLRRFHDATSKVERELYYDACNWIMSDDLSWPFSFFNVCQILHREPAQLRQDLLGDLAYGPLGKWARRSSRALGRVRDCITRRFGGDDDLTTALPVSLVRTWH